MDRKAWMLFAAVVLLWGVPYYFIKVALHDLSPQVIVWLRVIIGALTLLPATLRSGLLRHVWHRFGLFVFLALIEIVVPFSLIAGGEQYISSSLTGILIATEPMFIALLALRFDASERIGRSRMMGLVVGLVGVAALLGLDFGGSSALVGACMILLATLAYAAGAMMIKLRFADVPAATVVVGSLALSAIVLALPAAMTLPSHGPGPGTVLAITALGTGCTGIGFLLFFALIGRTGAGRATLITYVSPIVAVLLGVLAGGEGLGIASLAGLLLILAGSWCAARPEPPSRQRAGVRAAR